MDNVSYWKEGSRESYLEIYHLFGGSISKDQKKGVSAGIYLWSANINNARRKGRS